jgi:hypothetical protein
MKSTTKRFTSLIIGLIFIITSFALTNMDFLRAILCILGIVLLTCSNSIERKHKKLFIPLFAIIFTCLMISTDYLVVCTLKKTPIFAFNIVKNDDATVYNAFGYRVWKCSDDATLKVDPLYKLGYYCSISDMNSEDINNILPMLTSSFNSYQDTYIKVSGKVTEIKDSQTIIMEAYTSSDNKINYNNSQRLIVSFNVPSNNVTRHKVNDDIVIAGKVNSIDTSNNITGIKIIDSTFVDDDSNDNNYDFSVDDNIYCKYDKELWFETADKIYYKSCINDLNITLNNNQYNLMNAIKNNNITLKDLESEASGYLTNSKDSSIIYTYDNFKLLICDSSNSKDVIIGRTSMSFSDGYCQNLESTEAGV